MDPDPGPPPTGKRRPAWSTVTEVDMTVKDPSKTERIREYQLHGKDDGSTPVQVANLTHRIRHLTEHVKTFPKDHATRRGLLRLVGRRSALLRYYARTNPTGYKELIGSLGLRR